MGVLSTYMYGEKLTGRTNTTSQTHFPSSAHTLKIIIQTQKSRTHLGNVRLRSSFMKTWLPFCTGLTSVVWPVSCLCQFLFFFTATELEKDKVTVLNTVNCWLEFRTTNYIFNPHCNAAIQLSCATLMNMIHLTDWSNTKNESSLMPWTYTKEENQLAFNGFMPSCWLIILEVVLLFLVEIGEMQWFSGRASA